MIKAAAAELPRVGLDDALAILIVLAQTNDPRFDRAAARWVGRLLTETPAGLSDARFAHRVHRRTGATLTSSDALSGFAGVAGGAEGDASRSSRSRAQFAMPLCSCSE